jgi:hypothetical protein
MLLPQAPPKAFHPATFRARVGSYAGFLDEVRWGYYRGWAHGQVRRALHRKRWFQIVLHWEHNTLLVRLDDDGLTGTGRLLLFDHDAGRVDLALDAQGAPLRTLVVGPHAGRGTEAFLRAGGCQALLRRGRDGDAWHLAMQWDVAELDLLLVAPGAPTAMVIGEARDPYRHRPGLVQRAALLPVTGRARVRGLPLPANRTKASLTYGNVFLPPFARGLSVTAQGGDIALALSDGDLLGDHHEATLFIDGQAHALPRAHILLDQPEAPWALRDADGTLDLDFTPIAAHRASVTRRFGQVHHDRRWLVGRLRGVVPGPSGPLPIDLPALGEDHRLRG